MPKVDLPLSPALPKIDLPRPPTLSPPPSEEPKVEEKKDGGLPGLPSLPPIPAPSAELDDAMLSEAPGSEKSELPTISPLPLPEAF